MSLEKPIHVLHMIGSLEVGGSQNMVLNLYKAIDRSKIQFDFIIDHPELMQMESQMRELGAEIYFMPTFVGKNICQVKKSWHKFFREHPEYKILHSHVRSYASIYIPIAKKYGVKTIIHSHSTSNGKGVSALIKAILQYPLRYQADYLMACSKISGAWLFGEKAIQQENYFFIPNAVDLSSFKEDKHVREKYRRDLNLGNKLVLGHVGRMMTAKNHLFLLDVFSEIHKVKEDAVLLLVGDGELRAEVESYIDKLELQDSVKLLGNRNDVANLMQVMDIFVFPSRWEGLPISVIEAQATGMPCIISDKISNDVDVSKLVERLPIDAVQPWVEKILTMKCDRCDVSSDIRKAGFDIVHTARTLETFYCRIWSEE